MADKVPPNGNRQDGRFPPQFLGSALTEIGHTQFVQRGGYGGWDRFRDRDQCDIRPLSTGA
jgi:hypothetical protein